MAGILSVFSVMITIGVVYNHARIALQEPCLEFTSLRVLGFTRAEVAGPLLANFLLQLLVAVPSACGLAIGWSTRDAVRGTRTRFRTCPGDIAHAPMRCAGAVVLLAARPAR